MEKRPVAVNIWRNGGDDPRGRRQTGVYAAADASVENGISVWAANSGENALLSGTGELHLDLVSLTS